MITIQTLCQHPSLKHSHYLSQFLEQHSLFLEEYAHHEPEDVIAILFSAIDDVTKKDYEIGIIKTHMRQMKKHIQCLLGLMEIATYMPLQKIWQYHSMLADKMVACALHIILQEMAKQQLIDYQPEKNHGFFVIAMGKWGGNELNFSSDIDAIIFFDPVYINILKPHKFEQYLNRYGRLFLQILNDYTADGYVFRTDLRLRPDPSVTPFNN